MYEQKYQFCGTFDNLNTSDQSLKKLLKELFNFKIVEEERNEIVANN